MTEAPRMQPEDLQNRLGQPGLTVLDVRREGHWSASDRKIRTARRRDPEQVESWAAELDPDRTYVLYCA
jgi:rhodanese-related sulfurtransferase